MSPLTHLLASWVVAAKTNENLRDVRLVTLAGVVPDADGLGLFIDLAKDPSLNSGAYYYQTYHHWLAHGIIGGVVMAILLAGFAKCRWRVFLLALVAFHLHLFCDLLGSRGPSPTDTWAIYYLGPLTRQPVWMWAHQWALEGWQNKVISVALLGCVLWMAVRRGKSIVALFNRRADGVVVGILRKWREALKAKVSFGRGGRV